MESAECSKRLDARKGDGYDRVMTQWDVYIVVMPRSNALSLSSRRELHLAPCKVSSSQIGFKRGKLDG